MTCPVIHLLTPYTLHTSILIDSPYQSLAIIVEHLSLSYQSRKIRLHWVKFILIAILFTFQLNGSSKPVPPPRDHLRVEKDGRLINIAVAPQVPDRNYNARSGQIAQVIEPTHEQELSIKKFQVSFGYKGGDKPALTLHHDPYPFVLESVRASASLYRDHLIPWP